VNIGLVALVIIVYLAVPSYIAMFCLSLRRIRLSQGVMVFISREMLVLAAIGALIPYLLVFGVPWIWNFLPPSYLVNPVTPVALILSANHLPQGSAINERVCVWACYTVVFYAVCFIWSLFWTRLLAARLLEKQSSAIASLLEYLGLWDLSSQVLAVGASAAGGFLADISHGPDGQTIFTGKLAGLCEHGPLQGLVLENVYIGRLDQSSRKRIHYYRTRRGDGTLNRMIFPKDKIINIHIRKIPKLPQTDSSELRRRLTDRKTKRSRSTGK
jgi:hypothetical protein